ncbi:MAG: LLM class F420-dependent oxidoreductase [Candidatus Binatia bacterium]|nr:MAG: LLM class F420-dependent oxidoreductase [Candidatus Binatia bacterium]
MRIGIGIGEISGQKATLQDLREQARRAEADGFASGWLANIFGFDAITTAALLAAETERIELGTAVVPTYPRHPLAMAQQALTARAASRGRFTLGIGLSHKIVIEDMLGLSWAKPYSHMEEYLAVLAPLLREGRVDYEGREFRVHAALDVPEGNPCPVLVAALAPRMLALAGRVADGTITWMTGPKTLESHTVPRICEAAEKAGRPRPRVVASLPVAVTTRTSEARESAARRFQIYGVLPSYRAMLDREGVQGPADVALVGDSDEIGARVEHLRSIGVTDFLAVPFPVGPEDPDSLERTRETLSRLARKAAESR